MNDTYKKCSDFLFSTSNFLTGVGTVLNLGGNYYEYNYSESSSDADKKAIENDFEMVGFDIRDAMNNFKNKFKNVLQAK